jgi:hypothetical protein
MKKLLLLSAVAGVLALPVAANAQNGAATGAAGGAVGGAIVGGPVGAAVGAGAGAVVGGLSDANRPRFKEYVVKEKRPSYKYSSEVRVGARLPESGVTYYDVPRDYGVTKYKYTIVNERPVLVDPSSHTVVEVID